MTGATGRHTATATSGVEPPPATARSRWLARLALVLAAMAAVVPLAAAGLRGSLGLALVGVVAVAVGLAAAWWFLTHRGLARTIAGVVVVVAPVVLIVILVRAGLLWVVIVTPRCGRRRPPPRVPRSGRWRPARRPWSTPRPLRAGRS